MDKILNLNSVDLYNQLYGLETLNPLVSVIDLNKATRKMTCTHWNYGVYALYLKMEKHATLNTDAKLMTIKKELLFASLLVRLQKRH